MEFSLRSSVASSLLRSIVVGAIAALAAPSIADASGLADFGRCLARSGATFYGASWCPHCRSQRTTLGDAMSGVRYVECSVDGGRETTAACTAAHIDGYPTWVFGDGSRASGEQSLETLASKTGCSLPSKGGAASSGSAGKPAGTQEHKGPTIIQVPAE